MVLEDAGRPDIGFGSQARAPLRHGPTHHGAARRRPVRRVHQLLGLPAHLPRSDPRSYRAGGLRARPARGGAPYDTVQASWKQRLDQPYVYLEHVGSYTETGTLLPALHRELAAQGLEPAGAPFCLFYDDPALVPAYQLRSRACVPIEGARSPQSPLAYDVLPSTTVAYAYTSGAYPDAPRAYPGIYRYMQLMNWVENGPIREIYLVPPGPGTPYSELVCEIQIPSAPRIQ
ncbi:MAG: GyrI-like domain-containing protein [Planctomycetota bacterium]